MSHYIGGGEYFYSYAMDLFCRAGHAATSNPIFINHSSERFVFFDVKGDASFSREQRMLLQQFNNVSRLFSFNGCIFLSINLLSTKNNRSQEAHDIHSMIHPLLVFPGSVCLFKCEDEVMLSFVGYGLRCMLSDWYPENDDSDELIDRLHISNMSIDRKVDYFTDIIYSLARSYYFLPKDLPISEYVPVNYFSDKSNEVIDRDDLANLVDNERFRPQREYGDDYVEYDETELIQDSTLSSDLDMMLLEMEEADEDIGNPFGEEFETDDDEEEDDELFGDEKSSEKDEYEFGNIDPEIFRDPTLMVKWLKKREAEKNKQ